VSATDPDSVARDSAAVIVLLSVWANLVSVIVWAGVQIKTLCLVMMVHVLSQSCPIDHDQSHHVRLFRVFTQDASSQTDLQAPMLTLISRP